MKQKFEMKLSGTSENPEKLQDLFNETIIAFQESDFIFDLMDDISMRNKVTITESPKGKVISRNIMMNATLQITMGEDGKAELGVDIQEENQKLLFPVYLGIVMQVFQNQTLPTMPDELRNQLDDTIKFLEKIMPEFQNGAAMYMVSEYMNK